MLPTNSKLKNKILSLPTTPGIYKYKNSSGKIIYIGKAKNLKKRVRSYFGVSLEKSSKTYALVQNIRDIEFVETLTELEALILEATLIKNYKPKYNVALKDDKSYLYIVIRPNKVSIGSGHYNIPCVLAARETDLKKDDLTFGPYPHGRKAKDVIRVLRKIFPYRDCSVGKFNKYQKLGQPCLYGHIGLCQGPCVGQITPRGYRKDLKKLSNLLSGEVTSVVRAWDKNMRLHAKKQEYEQASKYRDLINKFNYVSQKFDSAQRYIDNPYLVDDLRSMALQSLVEYLPVLVRVPDRIECYDISTLSGTASTGSMVVATSGELDKSQYRQFKIRSKKTPDDFAMMEEVLTRRLKRNWQLPDLLVVDGGKGQLSTTLKVLDNLNMSLPTVGLAKKFETIVYFDEYEHIYKELSLEKDNPGLLLLQKLRDESHRFAQRYHHKLRLKSLR